jgi:hypothetical protein
MTPFADSIIGYSSLGYPHSEALLVVVSREKSETKSFIGERAPRTDGFGKTIIEIIIW